MTELADQLAHLTGFRDRDMLDVTLASGLRDLLQPRAVTISRAVGEPGRQHWLLKARLDRSSVAAVSDPPWSDLDSLPKLADMPARHECLLRQEHQVHAPSAPGEPTVTLFPLATDREVVGVVEVASDGELSAENLRTVRSILRIYRNFEGLLDYSERDMLTGLLNRKTFDESFLKIAMPPRSEGVGRRAAEHEQQHWLGVIDIDHFKLVNDNHGHLIGDEVLLLLSRLMRSTFRFHDRLYRFGGEEFVVLMRCGSEADAAAAFERLRGNTERYAFPQVGRITASIGFTQVRPTDTPSDAFARADKAVYRAKGNGRNQVVSHDKLLARGEFDEDRNFGDMELF